MRDLTTIQLDEIRRGGLALCEDYERADALAKAINRSEPGHSVKRAICRRDIHSDTGWTVAYGNHQNRGELLSTAQRIRYDRVADGKGLGLDALIGLLYSPAVGWDTVDYATRLDMWIERLAYTAPEVLADEAKFTEAFEQVEPLIFESVDGFTDGVHRGTVRAYAYTIVGHNLRGGHYGSLSSDGPHAAQNEGIAQVRRQVRDLHKLYPNVRPWAKMILAGHGLVEVVSFPFLACEDDDYHAAPGSHLVLVRMTPGDPTSMTAVGPDALIPPTDWTAISDEYVAIETARGHMGHALVHLEAATAAWAKTEMTEECSAAHRAAEIIREGLELTEDV